MDPASEKPDQKPPAVLSKYWLVEGLIDSNIIQPTLLYSQRVTELNPNRVIKKDPLHSELVTLDHSPITHENAQKLVEN